MVRGSRVGIAIGYEWELDLEAGWCVAKKPVFVYAPELREDRAACISSLTAKVTCLWKIINLWIRLNRRDISRIGSSMPLYQ